VSKTDRLLGDFGIGKLKKGVKARRGSGKEVGKEMPLGDKGGTPGVVLESKQKWVGG